MLAALIQWCIDNKAMVLILLAALMAAGVWAVFNIRVDAIPDLSDVQVIIWSEYPGQAPQIVEDQVTYPLTTAMIGVPFSKAVRGYSMFGTSFVYIIFEDGTDIYWARSRVLEQLSVVAARLPAGVTPRLGPDATGVGWVYEYMLVTGAYCPQHPEGLWHDPARDEWLEKDDGRPGLEHHRIFAPAVTEYVDPRSGRAYPDLELAPEAARGSLKAVSRSRALENCPLDGSPLVQPDIDIAGLRSLQDWYLRFELTTVDGVSEIAAVGGAVRQYQVTVDPVKLRAYGIPLRDVRMALERANLDTGGSVLEMSETEYMVRGRGYLGTLDESRLDGLDVLAQAKVRETAVLEHLRAIALGANDNGSPIYLRDVGDAAVGPEMRRGIAEWNGEGETVGGIVVMRFGENARRVIEGVRAKLEQLRHSLPEGVDVVTAYDRSDLIDRSIDTLTNTLIEEITVVSLIIILFLIHARSALVAAVVLPAGVLTSILIMHLLGINANIMSLGGIAIAIGVMVDSSIVMVENAHNHLERERRRVAAGGVPKPHVQIISEAAKEVGPSLFFSLLVITISFVPVFTLTEQSGRLFRPLAFTKTFAMAAAALLAVTAIPPLMAIFIRERMTPRQWPLWRRWAVSLSFIFLPALILALIPLPTFADIRWWIVGGWTVLAALIILPQKILPEEKNPLSILLIALYRPFYIFAMRFPWQVIGAATFLVLITILPLMKLGSEFMPPLEEGDFLYMPNSDPGLSVTKARELLQQTDKLLRQFPEVKTVMGKIGRAETATDPAPMTMIETTIVLERDKSQWRQVPDGGFLGLFPGTRPITLGELVDGYELPDGARVPGINNALTIPGLTGALTRGSMPIKTRIDMLATGIRTPIGVKVYGPDLAKLEAISDQVVQVLKTDPRVRDHTAYAALDRSSGGNYVDITIRRDAIARHALAIEDVQDVIMTALGGMNVTYTIEGRERYPINIRYPRELREDIAGLREVLVATPAGAQIPLAQLADIEVRKGPPMIRSENARPTNWVYVDVRGIDLGTYVARAREAVAEGVALPDAYTIAWSGQYEYMEVANRNLAIIVPIAALAILLLLYLSTRSWMRTLLIFVTLSFSIVGAVWMLYFLGFNLSVAVWVGIIALAGLDAETSLVMLLFLDSSIERMRAEGRMRDRTDLWHAVYEGAVLRIRPKTMTVLTSFIGLLPLMWAAGAGADTMRRLAAPMLGGLFSSFLMELFIYPAIYYLLMKRRYPEGAEGGTATTTLPTA